jgi:thiamine-phosphate pyrophosphorylase
MLVTDRRRASRPLPELTRLAIAGGVDAVQIREKDMLDDHLRRLVESVVAEVGQRSRVLVNGSVEVAEALGVGLHLPESGSTPLEARGRLGPARLIGRSGHSPRAAAESAGADYLIAGHVFVTASKPDRPPIGLAGLERIVAAAPCPVLAIGGISAGNVGDVLTAGAHGAAVISAINGAPDPMAAARVFRELMSRHEEVRMEATTTIEVTINGKTIALDAGTTIHDFLQSKGFEDRLVVVELNEAILPRAAFPSTSLDDGDRVEIVHFVGGG